MNYYETKIKLRNSQSRFQSVSNRWHRLAFQRTPTTQEDWDQWEADFEKAEQDFEKAKGQMALAIVNKGKG